MTLLGWAVVATALEAAVLACALQATGGGVPVLAVAGGYAALRLLWMALPVSVCPAGPRRSSSCSWARWEPRRPPPAPPSSSPGR